MKRCRLSALSNVARGIELPVFLAGFPYSWLVLERGVYRPPTGCDTMLPTPPNGPLPILNDDPLAVPLVVGNNRARQVTLGRGPTCDIQLGEATVSHLHLLFMEGIDGAWTVRDASSRNGTWIGKRRLAAGEPHVLEDGDSIRVAQVQLTFYRPAGLYCRVRGHAGLPLASPTAAPRAQA